MLNYSLIIFAFIGGFLLHKYGDKINKLVNMTLFTIKNYKTIKKSRYYNDFIEDYISSADFERSDDHE